MLELPTGTVTFLFTDIEGSTRRWERDRPGMPADLAQHDRLVRRAIEEHRGHVFKTVGDAFCAAFATATDALAAALTAQRALAVETWQGASPIRVRMAIHAGVAEQREKDYFGPAVNRVARLLSAGHGGQILLSAAAQELVQDVPSADLHLRERGLHRLKDLDRPERIFDVVVADLPSDFPSLKTLDAHPTNLPLQLTPFVGREQVIATVSELLQSPRCRLVTLTGPGGTGKTRLALQVAAELVDAFDDGVFFVELAAIDDPNLVVPAIAETLRVREVPNRPLMESLTDFLRGKTLLLLLDNFEQVTGAAIAITDLLRSCPHVKLFVTSRHVLRVSGEREFAVPPLTLPEHADGGWQPAGQEQSEAVRLFVDRAQAVNADFAISEENARAVVEICRRLDGLPLAIELAAARTKHLTTQAILARLESRLTLLTGGARDLPARQRTLRDAIAWSHDLLTAKEQTLFRRLGVFAGGWTLEAAEAICNPDGDLDVFDVQASLTDKSLLRPVEELNGESRFAMLETIREFALEQLAAAEGGEEALLRLGHAEYWLALAEQAAPALYGSELGPWLARLEAEHDNLRAALAWSLGGGDPAVGVRLATALSPFWDARTHYVEGRNWLERALSVRVDLSTAERTKAIQAVGQIAFAQGDLSRAAECADEALRLARAEGDRRGIAKALDNRGNVARTQGDYPRAEALYEEEKALLRALDDRGGIATTLTNLGLVANLRGDFERAEALHTEALAMARQSGDREGVARSLANLGVIAFVRGEYGQAKARFEEALAIRSELGARRMTSILLSYLGNVAHAQGDFAAATAHYSEALALERELGIKRSVAVHLYNLGLLASEQGDNPRAIALHSEALAISRELGDRPGIATALTGLGTVAVSEGDLDEARALHQEALALRRELGDRRGIAGCLAELATVAFGGGDLDGAEALYAEALTMDQAMGELRDCARSLEGLAGVAVGRHRPERAARLYGAAAALRERINAPLPPDERSQQERTSAIARDRLGAEAYAAAWEAGRALSLDEAVVEALASIGAGERPTG